MPSSNKDIFPDILTYDTIKTEYFIWKVSQNWSQAIALQSAIIHIDIFLWDFESSSRDTREMQGRLW